MEMLTPEIVIGQMMNLYLAIAPAAAFTAVLGSPIKKLPAHLPMFGLTILLIFLIVHCFLSSFRID
jgi:hypothetical protein